MSRHYGFDGYGRCTGECGDSIEVYLQVKRRAIERALFHCHGCAHTALAAGAIARLAEGRPLTDALQLKATHVLDQVSDLDEEHEHCAVIAANALHDAVTDALRYQQEPWKLLYR
jgi:nitrogen fixation NifU-like protein